jgi:hypothetical protein
MEFVSECRDNYYSKFSGGAWPWTFQGFCVAGGKGGLCRPNRLLNFPYEELKFGLVQKSAMSGNNDIMCVFRVYTCSSIVVSECSRHPRNSKFIRWSTPLDSRYRDPAFMLKIYVCFPLPPSPTLTVIVSILPFHLVFSF